MILYRLQIFVTSENFSCVVNAQKHCFLVNVVQLPQSQITYILVRQGFYDKKTFYSRWTNMPSIKLKKLNPDRKEHPGLITLLKTKLTPFKGETTTLELSKNMEPVENPLKPQKAVCGHVLHPVGAPESLWRCPACHVNDSLDSLRRIAKSWAKFGGPDHEKITSVQDHATYRTRMARHEGKAVELHG